MSESGVSFLSPVYNKASHLETVLGQIRRQTGDYPRQYVFVDDGSTDDSLAMLRDITAGWDNVVIESQENKGSAGATNRCIALADQPFIKFVDADDLICDHATETLLHALQGSEACLAFGRQQQYGNLSELDLAKPLGTPATTLLTDGLRMAMKNSLFNPTQFLARTAAVKQVGGCDERIVHSQEYSLTLRLARHWPMLEVDTTLAFIPHESKDRLSTNEARQLQRVTRALANFLRDYPDTPAALRRFACRRAAGRAWKYARRRQHASIFSSTFLRYAASLSPFLHADAGFIDACCAAFDTAAHSAPATG